MSVANIFVYTRTRTDEYIYEIFCDFIALIELILSVKIKFLLSASFSIWSITMWIAASSAVKTLVCPLIRNPILQFIDRRQNQPPHPSVNHQCKINSMERTMQHPPLIRHFLFYRFKTNQRCQKDYKHSFENLTQFSFGKKSCGLFPKPFNYDILSVFERFIVDYLKILTC
jgi:hypothetical protein